MGKPDRAGGWRRKLLVGLLTVYPVLLLALSLAHILRPQRDGLLALTQVFAPYLFAPLLLLAPFALLRGAHLLRIMLVLCALLFGSRYLPPVRLEAAPADNDGDYIYAMNWNAGWGGQPEQVRSVLERQPAGIVAMLETNWQWIERDATLSKLYPYRLGLNRNETVNGMALLSVYPIIEKGVPEMPAGSWPEKRLLWARLDVGGGQTVVVIAAHPEPAEMCKTLLPWRGGCYDPSKRDKRLRFIRDVAEWFIQRQDRVLLLGDFNVTEREPAYNELSRGLLDAHRVAGSGPGSTWRPAQLMNRQLPLLRIDYQFSTPDLVPVNLSVDCTPRGSDHCLVQGRYRLR